MANVIKHKRGSGSDPSASNLVVGELAIRTDTGKLFTKMDSGALAEIAGGGSDIAINTLSSSSGTGGGSATFNGSAYRFTLSSPPSVSAAQLLVSINGVIQKPVAGTGQPSEGFSVDGNDIILGDAPATGSDFFILTFRSLGVSVPADNSVTSAKIVDGAIVNADINASAAIQGTKIFPDFGSQNITTSGEIEITGTNTVLKFTEDDANPDFGFLGNGGTLRVQDITNSANLFIFEQNRVRSIKNFDAEGGLDVTGAITGTGAITLGNGSGVNWGDTSARIIGESGGSGLLRFDTNGGEKMRIDSSGVIEAKTRSAEVRRMILAGSPSNSAFNIEAHDGETGTSAGDVQGKLGLFYNDGSTLNNTANLSFIRGSGAPDGEIAFVTNQTERMRIDSSGRVGIGTTPEEIFHIKGPTETIGSRDGVLLQHSTASNAADNGLPLVWSGYISASNTNYGLASICGRKENSTDNNGAAYLQFGTGNGAGAIAEKMRIDSSGRLLLGTTTGASTDSGQGGTLTIANTNAGITLRSGTSNVGSIYFSDGTSGSDELRGLIQYNHSSNFLRFWTDANERMRIDSSGNVGIGTTSPNETLTIINSANHSTSPCYIKANGSNNVRVLGLQSLRAATSGGIAGSFIEFFKANGSAIGSVTGENSISYNTTSDYRLKENVVAISDGITRLKTLKPSRFNWIVNPSTTVDGFLAHEVTAVPEAVTGTKDEVDENNEPVYQGIDQSKLVPLLVAALQEAIGRIEVLEAK